MTRPRPREYVHHNELKPGFHFVCNISKHRATYIVVQLAALQSNVYMMYHPNAVSDGKRPPPVWHGSIWTLFPDQDLTEFWELLDRYQDGIPPIQQKRIKIISKLSSRIAQLEFRTLGVNEQYRNVKNIVRRYQYLMNKLVRIIKYDT